MRLLLILTLTLTAFSLPSFAKDTDETDALDKCLRAWKKNPFRKNPDYRVLKGGVKVLGVGGAVEDNEETKSPQLVLVEPSVSVLTKSTFRLMNPNGWYCLKAKVDVLSKTNIELHCKANLATSGDKTTVLGSNDKSTGTTILGKVEVTRFGCAEDTAKAAPEAKKE